MKIDYNKDIESKLDPYAFDNFLKSLMKKKLYFIKHENNTDYFVLK